MNWKAVEILYDEIAKTPIISIDDAFIGICMSHAGYEDNILPLAGFSLGSRIGIEPNICTYFLWE